MLYRRLLPLFAILFTGVVTACGAARPTPVPTPMPSPSFTATPEPYLGPFIPLGEPVTRELGTTTERVRNCVPDGEQPIIKTPSGSVVTGYNVQWSVGGTTGMGLQIGAGPLPVAVNLGASLEATYGNEVTQSTTRGTGWELPAKPNTIVTYILRWGETWQPGYVEFRVFGQSAMPIDVMYRLDVTSEIVAEDVQSCGGTSTWDPSTPPSHESVAMPTRPAPTPTSTLVPPSIPLDCMAIVSTSRPVAQMEDGPTCWLKLYDGGPATITFNDTAQVTFMTIDGGSTVYYYEAKAGDELSGVIGATIRPLQHIRLKFGDFNGVRDFEIMYHSPGFTGGWVTCLRDANNNDAPMNAQCN